jgi:hypothetical protein
VVAVHAGNPRGCHRSCWGFKNPVLGLLRVPCAVFLPILLRLVKSL